MTESLLAMAKELALAHIQAGQVTPEEMASVLNSTYETLQRLNASELSESPVLAPPSPTSWKKSITKHSVTCMECGATFKQLSTRHLRVHDLDGQSYRKKYGIPRTQSLASREVHAKRVAIVQRVKPWEKSPTNQKAQAKVAAKAPSTARKKAPKKARRKTTAKQA